MITDEIIVLAHQGNVEAQKELASAYLFGRGISQNYNFAMEWFQKAAEQGDAAAQYDLGTMYALSFHKMTEENLAEKWFRKAAEQKLPAGQRELGLLYLKAEGVPRDYDIAAKWLIKAAQQGESYRVCRRLNILSEKHCFARFDEKTKLYPRN